MKIEEAKEMIGIVREVLVKTLSGEKFTFKEVPEFLNKERGVFVTLLYYPSKELKGCIGIVEPRPLKESLIEAAKGAAFNDPRFPPLRKNELDKIIVEISILTKPELIDCSPEKYSEKIEIGKDGLIVEFGVLKGLLLPQVAVEHKMSAVEFLSHTCIKAGLPPMSWMDHRVKVYKFQAEVFGEESPNGPVKRIL